MDAISFVLGVHSSHLRSQTLKDMIYRPSALQAESRSNGARRAHVMLVYQTSTGQEIRFKRIVQQSGQSEYRINNRQVTYAEYNAALEQENILVKAKNFLVFQGDVESIASQNAKDLTRLIEQISGSWELKEEYDLLKKEQERAIEDSAHTFNKRRGVVAEKKQYEEQKKEAERFESLVRERRGVVVQYLLWKLYHLEQKTAALEKEAGERRIAAEGASEDQLQLEEHFRAARKEQALIHREKTRRELQIKKLKKELENHRPNLISIQEQINHLEKRIEQTGATGERLKREHAAQAQEVNNLNQSLSKLNKAEQDYEASLPKSGFIKGPVLTPDQAERYEQLKQRVSILAIAEQQQLDQLERQRKLEEENVKRLTSKADEFNLRKHQLLEDERQLNEDGQTLVSEAQKVSQRLEDRKKVLISLAEERKNNHLREVQLNENLQLTLNKLMEAKLDQRESERESRLREGLVMMKQIFPGVHGRLVDLCRPTVRKYDTAVATVLGRNLDAIVVEDQKTAIDCIQYMRDQRMGAATFLPLNSIHVPAINDRFRNYTRGSRLAVDVISCGKNVEPVVRYACGNTLVCDTLNIAKQICYEKNEEVRAVTLDGTVINPSGLITGGQTNSQAQMRWQESDIESLTRTRDKLLAELSDLNKRKRMGSAEEAAKSDCAALEGQLIVLREEINTMEQKLQDVRNELRFVEEQLMNSETPYVQTKEKLDSLTQTIQGVTASIAQVENKVFAELCTEIGVSDIREYESLRFGLPEEVIERRTQFATQRSRLETQISFEKEQLADLEERLSKLERMFNDDTQALSHLQTELKGATERMRQLTEDLAACNAELHEQAALEDEKQEAVDQLRVKLESKGRDVEAYLKDMAKYEAEMEKVHAERVASFRKCKLEDIALPFLRGSMDDVIFDESPSISVDTQDTSSMDVDEPSQLSIRSTDWAVEVDYTSLEGEAKEDPSPARDEKFKDDIKRLSDAIDDMAPNMKAIDRLGGVEVRLKEAEEAYGAARRATKRAKEEFVKIKKERYARFMDAFSHISSTIDTVYKDLTKTDVFMNGGTAYLTLLNSEEPYLDGITYHAIPPMKKFRDMEQLSGGEKSIAALALLFAIHRYKPSPFFVLDEVDAALDNTNIIKVASYIREHASDDFQFIVISLKNTLYEKAKSLVGIYKDQEANSSKTLSLMLDAYQE
ncbi:hypothetical protein BX666DRAFT_2017874 [Dichotomocladium elegans]|nr:hypothetical protein BX666DRAFT_2017874 [Dichotomocladium elegans]